MEDRTPGETDASTHLGPSHNQCHYLHAHRHIYVQTDVRFQPREHYRAQGLGTKFWAVCTNSAHSLGALRPHGALVPQSHTSHHTPNNGDPDRAHM